jgi:hypothetical protein
MRDWFAVWNSADYQLQKEKDCILLDSYLINKPAKMIEIGCGLATESRFLNSKYNTELWLMDGDVVNNDTKSETAYDIGWKQEPENFLYYNKLDSLDQEFQRAGLKNYHLVDCNNIQIDSDVKFDLIYSALSYGFHYTLDVYKELIKKHSHKDTKIIVDLRTRILKDYTDIEIVNVLYQGKNTKAEIKFKD